MTMINEKNETTKKSYQLEGICQKKREKKSTEQASKRTQEKEREQLPSPRLV